MAHLPKQLRIMKRFLILLLALLPIMAAAQKVEKNERDEKGVRYIETQSRMFTIGQNMKMCGLIYQENKGIELYSLVLYITGQSSRWIVKQGQELMMKDAVGNVATIVPQVSSKSTIARGAYATTVMYSFTQEQADYIRNGLVKLRINMTYQQDDSVSYFDIIFPDDMTSHLKKAIKNIEKTIPLPVTIDKSVF